MILQLPSLGPIAPPPGIWGAGVALLQCLAILGSFSNEINNPTLYSKFAMDKEYQHPISSRNGMFRIYAPSMLVAATYITTTWNNDDTTTTPLVAPLLFLHFFKRVLEVALVHDYSGTMPSASGNMIGTYYALITLLVASTAVQDSEYPTLGLTLFAIGEVGNFYHHYLLSTLRNKGSSNNKEKRYVAPTGGLFAFVAAPHYLFELVAWLGMAICAQQLNAFLVFASMASYLSGRAYKTNEMYLEQFSESEWPKSRKAIIPGIF